MYKLLSLIGFLLIGMGGFAQDLQGKIEGKVKDGAEKTLESATISLHQQSDSAVLKFTVADKTGLYSFENIGSGTYFVSVSAVGHTKGFSPVFSIDASHLTVSLETIEILPANATLDAVVVTSKKPVIEMKAGKMLVNVDASPTNEGLNALEVLEKSPGITVDNDGNISLKGKQGVMILVDGKPTYMSGADLAALLKSMSSSTLEQIEIMTNPPAKYDAAGNAGIINIKTKKGRTVGMNGNANAGYTQGRYPRYNAGVNLNYRNEKINLFGGANTGTWSGYNRLAIDRKFFEPDNVTVNRQIDQISRPRFQGQYNSVKLGMDYYFSKKDVAGIVLNGNFSNGEESPMSLTNIRDAQGNLLSRLRSSSDNTSGSDNFTANFNYKHTFDSTGREISTDLDYATYNSHNKTSLLTKSFSAEDEKVGNDITLNGDIPAQINIYSAKVDYVHPFKSGYRLEAGWKSSLVNTDNKVNYVRNSGYGWEVDENRSNYFIYDENINAVYGILSKNFKKWDLTAGLRMENTNAKGTQVKTDSTFKRNYTNLFPNLGISYNMSDKHQFNLSYSRRVKRPDYDDLNPFVFFLDSLTYGQGNPYLQPQFTHNIEVSHTFNRFLTTTINYTQTNDIIADLLKQDSEKNVTFQTKDNFNTMKQLGLVVMVNKPVTKWWMTNLYVNVYNNHYEGLYQNDPIDIQFTSMVSSLNNNFTFGKGFSGEISGWYRTKATEGLLVSNPMGALNVGLSKSVLQKKGTIKVGVRDVLWTQKFSGYVKYSDVDVVIASRRDSRQFNISFTYRFGKSNIAPARRRTGGADDEQSRVNAGGNN